MDSRQAIVGRQQDIVEEVVDQGGEDYDELVLAEGDEELFLDGEEIDVEDLDQIEGEYIEIDGGQFIASQHVLQQQHPHRATASQVRAQAISTGQAERRAQLSDENTQQRTQGTGHVYAIRGNQVFRVDKNTGEIAPVRGKSFKEEKHAYDSQEGSSKSGLHQTGPSQSTYSPLSFRAARDALNHYSPLPPPKPPKRYMRKTVIGHKKPCNCTKSMCLKLYCDCFANGEFCSDCNCKDCHNNLEHEAERSRAIRSSLERNPNAFKPKIGIMTRGRSENERLHQKGCHCKKSNCLKNYCECYEAKVACTDRCKCQGCKNTEIDRANKFGGRMGPAGALLSLANVASMRSEGSALGTSTNSGGGPSSVASTGSSQEQARPATPFSDEDSEEGFDHNDPKKKPWFYMTDEVVEACTLCLVAKAEELESHGGEEASDEHLERAIMEEFSKCLRHVIASSAKAFHSSGNRRNAPAPSPSPSSVRRPQSAQPEESPTFSATERAPSLQRAPSLSREPSFPAVTAVVES